jgi:S-ribosylhomocysteine lyase
MKKIASFTVDHDKLKKGMYISRIDGDCITYDIRMKIPNGGDYLSASEAHTIEHLFATYARNSKYTDSVIYVGPMGCRTGFYMIMRDNVSHSESIELVREVFEFISKFEGEIPGNKKKECGNYLDHDLPAARSSALDMCSVLADWTEDKLIYEA